MNEAPWWLGPMVTILGVLLAQVVVVLLFFAKQKAEDKRRWHERRIEDYALFNRRYLEVSAILNAEGLAKDASDPDSSLVRQLADHIVTLQLLAGDEVGRTAGHLLDALIHTTSRVREDPTFEPNFDRLDRLQDAVVAAMRKELRI